MPATMAAVTQTMLAEYEELCRLSRRRDELRLLILERLEGSARIEPGQLTAYITRGEMHKLTVSGLRAVIGEENLRVFMAEIPPIPFRRLHVRKNVTIWTREYGSR